MGAHATKYGMHATRAEDRRDAGELYRRAQEALAQRTTVFGVVKGFAGAVGVAERGVTRALVDERGSQDVATAQLLAIAIDRIVDHAEAVALARVPRC